MNTREQILTRFIVANPDEERPCLIRPFCKEGALKDMPKTKSETKSKTKSEAKKRIDTSKRKPKLCSFYNDMYFFRFYLALFCKDEEDVEGLLRSCDLPLLEEKEKLVKIDRNISDATTYFLKRDALIVLWNDKDFVVDLGLLVHEIVHVATHLCEITGIQLCYTNDEPYAYLVQWLLNQVLQQEDVNAYLAFQYNS